MTKGIPQGGGGERSLGKDNEADSQTGKGKQESGERSESWEVLGDFTTTTRLLPISGLALAIGVVARVCCFGSVAVDRIIHKSFLFRAVELRAGIAGGQPSGSLQCAGAGGRRTDHRLDGPLRVGKDSRTRDSRGHRGDPD